MKNLFEFNNQKERIVSKFLKNREKAYKTQIAGKVWCHSPEMSNFYNYWDRKFNRILKAVQTVWLCVSEKY